MKYKRKEICFLDLIKNTNHDFKVAIKKIYKLKYDTQVISWENIKITFNEFKKLRKIAYKKLNGKDITFLIGYRYFRNNKIFLKKGVFVPQYDTEQILDFVHKQNIYKGKALEVGTGSGAISIALSSETKLKITSIDINSKSIKLAKKNDANQNINFLKCDFKEFNSDDKFDLIISNPPYIGAKDKYVESWVKKNQPSKALYADKNGLAFYELIFKKSKKLLKKGGYIILEIGWNQSDKISKIMKTKNIKIFKDYSGYDRFMVIKYE